jgi:hypothetical protein
MQCVLLAGELKRPRHIEIATASLVLLLTPAWRKMMTRTILVAAAALASVSFSLGHAEGAQAPWCALIDMGTGDWYWDCQYGSFEDCYRRGNILAGNRGFCTPSPYYVAGSQRQTPERHARPY